MIFVLYAILIGAVSVAAYSYAVARTERLRNADLREWNKILRSELHDWQNKALLKHGSSTLGATVRKTIPKNTPKPSPVGFPTRAELEVRRAQKNDYPTRKTPIPEIIAKAREITANE